MSINDVFYEINAAEMGNAHKLIGKDWMLITVRDGDGVNAMTASWGALGELWGAHIAVCFVRPQRYTYELLEGEDTVSLAFFDHEYRDALKLCGSRSGRECDKLALAGLSAEYVDGVAVIGEARMIVIGKKLYVDDIKESCFVDKSLLDNYKAGDYHRVYILKIEKVLLRK